VLSDIHRPVGASGAATTRLANEGDVEVGSSFSNTKFIC
jgi:hypothetical protein